MWILKGILLGLLLLGFGTLTFFYIAVYRNLTPNSAVDIRVFTANTIQNPLWWIALTATIALACWFFRTHFRS